MSSQLLVEHPIHQQNDKGQSQQTKFVDGIKNRRLVLCKFPIDGCLMALLSSAAPQLEQLLLWGNDLGDQGIQAISQNHWPRLRKLRIAENNLTWRSMKYLTPENFPVLEQLSLYGNPIGNKGAHCLSRQTWPHLQSLLLHNCDITDAGVDFIVAGHWPRLSRLNLGLNNISNSRVLGLAKLNGLGLKSVFAFNKQTSETRRALVRVLSPGLKLMM